MEKKRDSFFLTNKKSKNAEQPRKEKFQKNERQKEFDKNRNDHQKKENSTDKKPFDKKAYRLKKYSKKYKLDQWEEQRKKKMLHKYQKSMKNEPMTGKYVPISFDEDLPDSTEVGRFVRHPDLIENEKKEVFERNTKNHLFLKGKEKYEKLQQQKLQKKQEMERVKEERMQKLQEYKKKKQERFKKLSKNTKKGQPVMTGRLEMLLEKIQKGS